MNYRYFSEYDSSLDGFERPYRCVLDSNPTYGDEFSPQMTEAEIAAVVSKWLEFYSWDVYPEVVLKGHSKRPDLIASKNHLVNVIETKKALGLPVLEQALSWFTSQFHDRTGLPHFIMIATAASRGRPSDLMNHLLAHYGIGWITVEKTPAVMVGRGEYQEKRHGAEYSLRVRKEGKLVPGSRTLGKVLRKQLNPDTRIATPGTTGSGCYMTEWKRTMLRIEQLMSDGESRTIAEIIQWLTTNGGYHWGTRSSALTGINTSLTRQKYKQIPYGFEGRSHKWMWDKDVTKSVIKQPERVN